MKQSTPLSLKDNTKSLGSEFKTKYNSLQKKYKQSFNGAAFSGLH